MARWNAEPVDSDWFDQNAPPENSAGPVDARPLDSGQDQAAAITRAFQQYLGRTPRPDEIAFHSQDPQFAYHIQNSPEAQAYQQRSSPQAPSAGGARTRDMDYPSPQADAAASPASASTGGYAPIGGYDFGKLSDPAHVGEGKYNPDVKLYSQALKALNYVPGSGFYPSGATLDEIVKWINAHGGQVSRNKDVLKFGSGVEVDTATDFREEGNPNSQFSFQDPRGRAPGYGTSTTGAAGGDAGGAGAGAGAGAAGGGLGGIMGGGGAAGAGTSELASGYDFGTPSDALSPFPGRFAYPSFEPPAAFQAPTGAEVFNDPGYQFRLDEGQKALERAAASKGALNTGGTLKAITRFGQDLGSQEYGQAYGRKLGEYQQQGGNARGDYATDYNKWLGEFNLARNQWNEGQDRPFNKLASIAGLGQTSQQNLGALGANYSGQYGNTLSNMAQGQGDYWTQGANSQAAGQVGGSNAWTDALSGIARTWAPQMYGGNQQRNYGGYW